MKSLLESPHALFKCSKGGKRLTQSGGTNDKLSHDGKLSVGVQVSLRIRDFLYEDQMDVSNNSFNLQSVSFWTEKNHQQQQLTNASVDRARHSSGQSATSKSSEIHSTQQAAVAKSAISDATVNYANSMTTSAVSKEDSSHRKTRHRKNQHLVNSKVRGGGRRPGHIGSSSSILSAGAREDDEKINLHSWTDFPPMNTRTSASHITPSLLTNSDGSPFKIQRSKDAPPWTLKDKNMDMEEDGKENQYSSQCLTSSQENENLLGRYIFCI